MAISLRETCQEYFDRRLREGWKCVSRDGPFVVLLSPDGIRKKMDLRHDVETLRPNGAGDETAIEFQFPDSDAHWDKVDEVVADDATTRVWMSDTSYERDLYALPASTGSGTISKITVHFRCYTHGTSFAKASIKSGTTVTDGVEKSLSYGWDDYSQEWALNPDDGEAWEWADIDELQIGVSMKGDGSLDVFCTQIYVEVDYTPDPPTVTTQAVTVIVPGGATLNGNITDEGDASIDEHGFCWKAGSDPVNIGGADGYSELGAGSEGAFDQAKTGLAEATEFYVRAYATNTEGTGYGAAVSFTTGQTHSGAVAIAPVLGLAVEGNRLAVGASPLSPSVGIAVVGNALQTGAAAFTPNATLAAIGSAIKSGSAVLAPTVALTMDSRLYILGDISIAPELGLSVAAKRIISSLALIEPEVTLAIAANYLTIAAALIEPDATVSVKANYITLATAAIAVAVSMEAIPLRIRLGGTVTIEIDVSLAVAAIRYMFVAIGLSGELAAGATLEIDTKKMTLEIDGVNAVKDLVGNFYDIPPGSSTLEYDDDEVGRDVDVDITYTPRDA